MHSKSTKNFFRVNDPVIDELTVKLRQTPDRAEQRATARRIVDREYDQVLRMWMPHGSNFVLFQPHLRNVAGAVLRHHRLRLADHRAPLDRPVGVAPRGGCRRPPRHSDQSLT
jgi:hypothetical protein